MAVTRVACPDDPRHIHSDLMCLYAVSKGRLCGQIRRGPRELLGCNIIGSYLLRFDANREGGEGAVQGTFEGVIVCPCG